MPGHIAARYRSVHSFDPSDETVEGARRRVRQRRDSLMALSAWSLAAALAAAGLMLLAESATGAEITGPQIVALNVAVPLLFVAIGIFFAVGGNACLKEDLLRIEMGLEAFDERYRAFQLSAKAAPEELALMDDRGTLELCEHAVEEHRARARDASLSRAENIRSKARLEAALSNFKDMGYAVAEG